MAELPYMQFFPADYLRDTEILSLSAQGGWMRMLCGMWHPSRRGVLSLRLQAMARLLHASEQTTKSIIEEIEECDVGQVDWDAESDRVTVTCRRMVRDWEKAETNKADISEKRAEAARIRWEKQRQSTGDANASAPAQQKQCPPESRSQIEEEREKAPAPSATDRSVGTRRPTLAQAKSAAPGIGVSPDLAESWWLAREASDWMRGTAGGGTTPVGSNWQADLKTYASRGNPGQAHAAARPEKTTTKLDWE